MKTTALLIVSCAALLLVACGDRDPTGDDKTKVLKDSGPPPDSQQPKWGTNGGPCYPNNTCNAGLECKAGKCAPRPDGSVPPPDNAVPPKDGPQPPPDGPQPPPDGPQPPPDQGPPPPDLGPPPPDSLQPPPLCAPPGYKKMQYQSDQAGDWTVALEAKSNYNTVSVSGAKAKQAAATFDFNVNWQQVAGFVASRPSSAKDAATESAAVLTAAKSAIYGSLILGDSGAKITSHDGFSAVSGTTINITLSSTSDVSLLRNNLLAVLAGVSSSSLSKLPTTFGAPATSFVVRLATVLRKDGRVLFIGAVTDSAGDQDISKVTGLLSRDLSNSSHLAVASASTQTTCEASAVATLPKNKVDFIWVADESGSMNDNRLDIANNAANLFTQAKNAGLDFRMGVTNVCSPTGSYKAAVGKFCSKISSSSSDMGGTDRFLLPTEAATFAACIKNPPGYEGGSEYGLVNAKQAVAKHLPRAANSPAKIRSGAQVVIIVVTDEFPQSLASTIGYSSSKTCTLTSSVQAKVDAALNKDYIPYFSGVPSAGSAISFFHTIGGTCKNACNAYVAHGYKELSAKFKGKLYDVCQKDLSGSIKKIIDGINAAGSALTLKSKPVSGSIMVAADSKTLARSRWSGFDYAPSTNAIQLFGSATVTKGSKLVVSYSRWK